MEPMLVLTSPITPITFCFPDVSASAEFQASGMQHDLSMTDQEVDGCKAALYASEARCAARSREVEDMASRGLVCNVAQREDELIQSKRNSSRSFLLFAGKCADRFEYYLQVRAAKEANMRNSGSHQNYESRS